MEVPAKFKSILIGLRYWLLAIVFIATSALLVSCSGGGDTTTTFTPTPTTTTTTVPTVADSLTIINTPDRALADGPVTITAFARNGTRAVVGELLTFEITDNNSGSDLNGGQTDTVEQGGMVRLRLPIQLGPQPVLLILLG